MRLLRSQTKNKRGQLRNSHLAFKMKVRRLVPVGPGDDVLELFAGDGELYRRRWCAAGCGATCDLVDSCVNAAARERPAWTVLLVEAHKALRAGVWRERRFSIVDIDCYGSPWKFLTAFFMHRRNLANPCRLVLSDHYFAKRNLAREDQALGFGKPGGADDYLAAVDRLLKNMAGAQGYSCVRDSYREGLAVQHVVTLSGPG